MFNALNSITKAVINAMHSVDDNAKRIDFSNKENTLHTLCVYWGFVASFSFSYGVSKEFPKMVFEMSIQDKDINNKVVYFAKQLIKDTQDLALFIDVKEKAKRDDAVLLFCLSAEYMLEKIIKEYEACDE